MDAISQNVEVIDFVDIIPLTACSSNSSWEGCVYLTALNE